MNNWQHLIMPKTVEFSFHSLIIFQMQEPTNLEENTKSPRHQKRKKSFKWGESTLWGGHFGHFHDMYVKYIHAKRIAFNFGFHF
jgi:hypothetical protein